MKKFLFVLTTLFFVLICFIAYKNSSYVRVLKINSPVCIYVDKNRNFIFDEKEPFIYDNIFYVKSDEDYSSDTILKNLTFEQKFILEYLAENYASDLLKNKFISVLGDDLYINGKSYKKLLTSSEFFYQNDDNSKRKILKTIEKYNINDYFILNLKSKKIHKLTCENGQKSKNIKIINKKSTAKYLKAKCCFNEKNIPFDNKSKNINIRGKKNVNNSYLNENINIYFSDLNSVFKPDNRCLSPACKSLKHEIDNAEYSIDFALYGFNNQPEIYNALINAKKRGVKIRWISNYDYNKNKYYPDIEKLKLKLNDYKTNKSSDGKYKYGLMHNKFFIFDNKKVYTGSANITSTDLSGFNANYSILINSPEIAEIYQNEFNQMYGGNFGINKKLIPDDIKPVKIDNIMIRIIFSPQSKAVDNYIIPLINDARDYIYIPMFFITQKNILSALINAKTRGVDIKVINDATNSHNKYSIHKILRENKIKVKTENYAGKMHMKSMIIDDKISLIGSMNFTSSGNTRNDENTVIIYNKEITEYMKSTFLYIWNKIPDKYETFDPRAESIESIGSCYDGIDNNFDDKIDFADIGCFSAK